MPKEKNQINLTLNDKLFSTLQALSNQTNKSLPTLCHELIAKSLELGKAEEEFTSLSEAYEERESTISVNAIPSKYGPGISNNDSSTFNHPELSDLLDIEAFQKLMDDFYAIAQIPMSIIDIKGKILVGVGWQDICTEFHRKHPVTQSYCLESDIKLSAGLPMSKYRRYKCKNNLWDIVTPLIIDGKHMGNIFSGQFFFDDEEIDREFFKAQAKQYGFNEEEYMAALDRVPRLNRETINHGMKFFIKLADTISKLALSNLQLTTLLKEHEQVTASLQKSEARLKRVQHLGKIGSWEWDFKTDNLWWSEQVYQQLGHQPGEFAPNANLLRNKLHPDDKIMEKDTLEQALAGTKPYDVELRYLLPDGNLRIIHSSGEIIRDFTGRALSMIGFSIDITARKQAEQALQKMNQDLIRSNKELEQYAYVASHDLKEPLRMTAGFVTLLDQQYGKEGCVLDATAKEYINFAVDGVKRMYNLINDLLTLSSINSAIRPLTPISVRTSLDFALANLQQIINDTNTKISTDELPIVLADGLQLTMLLQNLIGNAVKFRRTNVQNEIRIGAIKNGNEWTFFIKDNGIGIPSNQYERIFKIFQQLHRRDKYPGTGIGLSICKKIIERHGGRIWVESVVNEGSSFFFTLQGCK